MLKTNTSPIIIISNEPWGKIWYSKQHYANELSKLGYQVIFIESPKYWNWRNIFNFKINQTKIKENLKIISYNNNLPIRIFPKTFKLLNDTLNLLKLKKIITKDAITWTFDPIRFSDFKITGKQVYHVVDPYMILPSTKEFDLSIAKNSDVIICTSTDYLKHYSNKFPEKKVLHIPHLISEDEFNVNEDEVKRINNELGHFVLFTGTLNRDVDFNLLYDTAKSINTKLVLIGKDNDEKSIYERGLLNQQNISFLGVKHAQDIKNYIAASQVCIVAYDFELKKRGENRSPLKILNYISQFKPVVTTIRSEIPTLNNQIIYEASNKEDFIKKVQQGLNNNLTINRDLTKKYLSDHTYTKGINKILKLI